MTAVIASANNHAIPMIYFAQSFLALMKAILRDLQIIRLESACWGGADLFTMRARWPRLTLVVQKRWEQLCADKKRIEPATR